jgi:hypothetical protein
MRSKIQKWRETSNERKVVGMRAKRTPVAGSNNYKNKKKVTVGNNDWSSFKGKNSVACCRRVVCVLTRLTITCCLVAFFVVAEDAGKGESQQAGEEPNKSSRQKADKDK